MGDAHRMSSTSMTFDVGGEPVFVFNDAHFARVRDKHGIANNFLAKFEFRSLRLFGGKGGNLMAFTVDKRFLVKELSKGDNVSLLKRTPLLVDRQITGDSLICPLYLHFQRGTKRYLVMRNVLPSVPGLEWFRKYDLKGNRDDKMLEQDGEELLEVHKRCFHVHNCWYGCDVVPCCTTSGRRRYLMGKNHAFETQFAMGEAQGERIVGMLLGDADVLAGVGVMDYSLIVGIAKLREGAAVPPADGLNQFVVSHEGWTYVYYLGVIDFLQEWTAAKRVAALIKGPFAPKPQSTVPPARYAEQFAASMSRKFKGEASNVVVRV